MADFNNNGMVTANLDVIHWSHSGNGDSGEQQQEESLLSQQAEPLLSQQEEPPILLQEEEQQQDFRDRVLRQQQRFVSREANDRTALQEELRHEQRPVRGAAWPKELHGEHTTDLENSSLMGVRLKLSSVPQEGFTCGKENVDESNILFGFKRKRTNDDTTANPSTTASHDSHRVRSNFGQRVDEWFNLPENILRKTQAVRPQMKCAPRKTTSHKKTKKQESNKITCYFNKANGSETASAEESNAPRKTTSHKKTKKQESNKITCYFNKANGSETASAESNVGARNANGSDSGKQPQQTSNMESSSDVSNNSQCNSDEDFIIDVDDNPSSVAGARKKQSRIYHIDEYFDDKYFDDDECFDESDSYYSVDEESVLYNKNDSNGTDDRNNQIQAVTPPKGSRSSSSGGNDDFEYDRNNQIRAVTPVGDNNSSSINSDETIIIRWKNQEFGFTRLPTFCTNLTDIFDRACHLGKLDDTGTATIVCPMHRRKLEDLKVLLFDAFKAIVEASPFPKPYRVHRTINHAGVYGLSMGSHGTFIKYGMSFDCFTRADRQSPGFAFKMADCNHLRNTVIPARIVQEIEDLGLPGIIFHKDHIERTRDLIAMQIYEGYLAAAHVNNDDSTCITTTIFERLVQEPPCLDHLACEESILVQAREFLSDLGGDGAYAILSWPTMKSIVYGIADESHSELIGRRLREQPEDRFVTLYWLKAILGKDNLCGWVNALRIPPEQNKLDGFLQAASGILDHDANSCNDIEKDQLQQALATITGANGKYYVRPDPSDETMADGFVSAFRKQKGSHYICVEHYVWKQVERLRWDWWEREMSGVTPLCLFDDLRIFLLTTNSGRRMIVVPSFFRAFDPEPCRLEVRIKLVKSLIAFLELLQHIGVHDADYVASVRKVLVSYIMALEFGSNDGNNPDDEWDLYQHDRSSARCAMPEGYMKQPLRNAITVSNAMGMNMWHHYYLELRLGRVKFRNLLLHMGLLHEQESWPSDPNWTCPGVPSSANIPAEACGYSNGDDNRNEEDDEEDDEPSACTVGKLVGKDAHVFHGRFVCRKCHRKLQRRELDELLSRDREELTPAQAERLEELLGRTSTEFRERKKQKLGHEAVLQEERARDRKNPRKDQERVKERNKKRDANRVIPSGERRYVGKTRGTTPYPQYLMNRFKQATLELYQKNPSKEIKWKNIYNLYIAILETHWESLPDDVRKDGRTPRKNDIKYRREQFQIASSKYLEPTETIPSTQPNKWYKSMFRVKQEFQTIVRDNTDEESQGKRLTEIIRDIATKEFIPEYYDMGDEN